MNSWFERETARRVALVVGVASTLLLLAGIFLAFLDRNAPVRADLQSWNLQNMLSQATSIAVPVIGLVLARRRSKNPIGWIFLLAGLGLALEAFGQEYAARALIVDPGLLPFAHFFGWIENWIWPIPIFMLIFLFLLFPNGHVLSRRWGWVGQVAATTLVIVVLGALVSATAFWSRPLASSSNELGPGSPLTVIARTTFFVAFAVFPIGIIAAFISVVLRYRRSVGEERLQLKWFATAAGFVAVTFAVSSTFSSFATTFFNIASALALLFLYTAIAIAVLRYRLYDIDVVIGRAVVFTSLAAFITVVYLAVVIGIGALAGNTRSPFLSAVAAALVAVAFQPVRERARRLANRVVYGKRATPYELLSGFTERAAGTLSTEDVLPRLVRVLAEGIGPRRRRCGSRSATSSGWLPHGPPMAKSPPSLVRDPTICPTSPSANVPFPCGTEASYSARSAWSRLLPIRSAPTGSAWSRTLRGKRAWYFATSG